MAGVTPGAVDAAILHVDVTGSQVPINPVCVIPRVLVLGIATRGDAITAVAIGTFAVVIFGQVVFIMLE
jgi:hypothetical protein